VGVGVFKRTDVSYLHVLFTEVDYLIHAIFASYSCLLFHDCEKASGHRAQSTTESVCEQARTALVIPQ
jgi:hypothetical protein